MSVLLVYVVILLLGYGFMLTVPLHKTWKDLNRTEWGVVIVIIAAFFGFFLTLFLA